MNIKDFFKLVAAIAIAQAAGLIGSLYTYPEIAGWYRTLERSPLTPPDYVFGPVWTSLYALMGIAAYLVWKEGLDRFRVKVALGLFLFQLAINSLWSIVFFNLHDPEGALAILILLIVLIIATMVAFARVSRVAAWLLTPYLLWCSFALYLNYSIVILN